MKFTDMLIRVHKVIDSCTTLDQLKIAKLYCKKLASAWYKEDCTKNNTNNPMKLEKIYLEIITSYIKKGNKLLGIKEE